ncbi:MAG: hypothetical protein Q8P68_05105 [Candidatus Peregrinibacteria bacterium]|nr:hypothetical protein [Candidatus Peregrinibacteria bacterium]MDZ4244470.1 hypothetical protein [Candidatus Gracilibacteria bacterium]
MNSQDQNYGMQGGGQPADPGGGQAGGFNPGFGGGQPAGGQPADQTFVQPAAAPPVQPAAAPVEPVAPAPVQPIAAPVTPVEPVAPVTPPASGGGAGDYVFGQIWDGFDTNIKLPPHQLQFDEVKFLKLLAGSISLTKEEKWKIIQYVPKLTQYKVEQLMKILEEEQRKFQELSAEHGEHLQKLEEKHASEWKDLEYKFDQKNQRDEDAGKADDIRKSLGL